MKNYYTLEMRIETTVIPDVIRKNLNKQFESKLAVLKALQDIGLHHPLEIIRVKWVEQFEDEMQSEKMTADAFYALFAPSVNLDI